MSFFAGVAFERFLQRFLTKQLRAQGVLPAGKRITMSSVGGEEVDLFCDEPLLVGEVTAHAETQEEVDKLLKKVRRVEEVYGKPVQIKMLIALTAERKIARRLRKRCEEEGINLVLGRTVQKGLG